MSGRLPGWRRVIGLALATAFLSVVSSAHLIFLPLGLMLLALPPRRPVMAALGLGLIFALLVGATVDPLADYGRGWALVLGAWFVIGAVMLGPRSFLVRGLFAVAAASLTAGGLLVLRMGSFAELDHAIARRSRATVDRLLGLSSRFDLSGDVIDTLYRGAELQAMLYPAFLAGASLAGLAVAWWAYRRLAVREREPLRPLREFRFPDSLAWLVVAGVVLMLPPLNEVAGRAGSNLLAFMALLYAMRGAAVLLFVGGLPGPLGVAAVAVVALVLYPIVMAAVTLIGLGDTWLDIRTRWRSAPNAGA